jgi:hypothetical protein
MGAPEHDRCGLSERRSDEVEDLIQLLEAKAEQCETASRRQRWLIPLFSISGFVAGQILIYLLTL